MYISKRLKWLREYVNITNKIYTRVKSVNKITLMRVSYSKRDRAYAEIRELDKGYQIALRVEYQHIDFYPLSVTLKPLSKIDILTSLAHELAHLYNWKHSPEHKILENTILNMFMVHLKLNNYEDEETELKKDG